MNLGKVFFKVSIVVVSFGTETANVTLSSTFFYALLQGHGVSVDAMTQVAAHGATW